MPSEQLRQTEPHFEAVEGLYQEAQMMMSPSDAMIEDMPESSQETPPSAEPEADNAPPTRAIIRSRKPKSATQSVPLFTRITDLYEEAEAARYEQTAAQPSAPDATQQPDHSALADDDFAIPSAFGEIASSQTPPDDTADDLLEALPEAPRSEITKADEEGTADTASDHDHPEAMEAFSDDDLAASVEEPVLSDDVEISTELDPAIDLDEVLDALSPPAHDEQAPVSQEAKTLAAMDADRPEADDQMIEKLAAVKSAVEAAQIEKQTDDMMPGDDADGDGDEMDAHLADLDHDDHDHDNSEAPQAGPSPDLSAVTAGPALASFIGETVREVLDDELPQMVRAIVDEALGERQGRYSRSETPHIGLRTKPSRH